MDFQEAVPIVAQAATATMDYGTFSNINCNPSFCSFCQTSLGDDWKFVRKLQTSPKREDYANIYKGPLVKEEPHRDGNGNLLDQPDFPGNKQLFDERTKEFEGNGDDIEDNATDGPSRNEGK
ncbi:hypothetical protein CAEBREN_11313 [Caenorhabditis brenneri]|uniref:Uncharacterized protein n=1 Tax=Caenorhabditis brenneri TaxID=135651 RepID=G0P362_CAEBE|nr:hypothetical protein CAEBREN_11313 [Caenorhabditis brenneri]